MVEKLNILKVALENNRMDVAAHVLVLAIVKVKTDQIEENTNGKKPRRSAKQ